MKLLANIISVSVFIIVLIVAVGGCSPRVYSPAIRHGAVYEVHGLNSHYLNLPPLVMRAGAVGFVNLKGQSTLQVAAAIGRAGLRFSGSRKTARLAIQFHLQGAVDSIIADTLIVNRDAFRPSYHYSIRLHVPPGRYKAPVEVTDLSTDVHTGHTARAAAPASEATGLGNVRAAAKDSIGWRPLVGYGVSGRADSLRFTLRIAPASADSIVIDAYLIHFAADSAISGPAVPLYYPYSNVSYHEYKNAKTSLVYQGIDYTDSTILQVDHCHLAGGSPTQLHFQFRTPPQGNYRFEVEADQRFNARDFAIRSPNFPDVRTPREQAVTLAYLMRIPTPHYTRQTLFGALFGKKPDHPNHKYKISYQKLMAIKNPDSLRTAVSRFWRANMDSAQARRVAAKYYRRVRQANRLFTNYKEGWKTDRGRIYIMYGKPFEIKPTHFYRPESIFHVNHGKRWKYDNGTRWSIVFYQLRAKSANFPFEHFILPAEYFHRYSPVEYQQQLWLSGDILNRKLWIR